MAFGRYHMIAPASEESRQKIKTIVEKRFGLQVDNVEQITSCLIIKGDPKTLSELQQLLAIVSLTAKGSVDAQEIENFQRFKAIDRKVGQPTTIPL